ncbi:unnamed protein product [Tilletia controversa]|uniref:Ricin B lectin domain-containing protein n=3 Tax=Tilletia TaxID=13289 RepID=A0A8X7MRY0_9BASI|nr:hypothetical protein CF336_g4774 [Tilletia laevis]KAE8195662.1 hypothetical protein CF328_g4366 [Tilletia controversa]KAE8259434.1 hypothetical protein A4X03_0g4095 [Tilletia caries]KAE8200499.1 hypothetical protein CF335_g3948 [Tilletia laevis]KAE8246115.1 hypothetical protein A4X06_0g5178 [Tilletia controversa]
MQSFIATTNFLALAFTGLVAARAAPPSFNGNGANITCETTPFYVANPAFYPNNDYYKKTYLGIQVQGEHPLSLAMKYGPYVQPPTPVNFYRCSSAYMPNSNESAYSFYGHLQLANDRSQSSCFAVRSLRNASDQKVVVANCKYTDGPTQLRQWWRFDQADDNVELSFVGKPDTKYDDGSFGSYQNVNLTVAVPYQDGSASFWGLHWDKAASQPFINSVQFEYNSS